MYAQTRNNKWRSVGLVWLVLALQGCTPAEPYQPDEGGERAVLVEGTGTYTRPISTDSKTAQQFFDQGLRLGWGFYFPEAIASHQEAPILIKLISKGPKRSPISLKCFEYPVSPL